MRGYQPIPVVLLAACGPGIGSSEFAARATAGISNPSVANDLRALLDLGRNELSACGDRARDQVRKGGPGYGDVKIVTYAMSVASQTVQIQPLKVESYAARPIHSHPPVEHTSIDHTPESASDKSPTSCATMRGMDDPYRDPPAALPSSRPGSWRSAIVTRGG